MSHLLVAIGGAIIALALIVTVLTTLAKAGRARRKPPPGTTPHTTGKAKDAPDTPAARALEAAADRPQLEIKDKTGRKVTKQMDKIVTEHPDEALSLLRRWMRGNNHAD